MTFEGYPSIKTLPLLARLRILNQYPGIDIVEVNGVLFFVSYKTYNDKRYMTEYQIVPRTKKQLY